MQHVPATEFARNFGRYRELAQREPVAVTSHDRVIGYFVCSAEFEQYRRWRAHSAKSLGIEDLSGELLELLANTKMDARHNHLNALMD